MRRIYKFAKEVDAISKQHDLGSSTEANSCHKDNSNTNNVGQWPIVANSENDVNEDMPLNSQRMTIKDGRKYEDYENGIELDVDVIGPVTRIYDDPYDSYLSQIDQSPSLAPLQPVQPIDFERETLQFLDQSFSTRSEDVALKARFISTTSLLPFITDGPLFRDITDEDLRYLRSTVRPDATVSLCSLNVGYMSYQEQRKKLIEFTACVNLLNDIKQDRYSSARLIGAVNDGTRLIPIDYTALFKAGFDFRRIKATSHEPLYFNDPVLAATRQLTDLKPMSIIASRTITTIKSYLRSIINQFWTSSQFDEISSSRIVRKYPAIDDLTVITFAKGLLLGFNQSTNHSSLLSLANLLKDCLAKIGDERKSSIKRKNTVKLIVGSTAADVSSTTDDNGDSSTTTTNGHNECNPSKSKTRLDMLIQKVSSV